MKQRETHSKTSDFLKLSQFVFNVISAFILLFQNVNKQYYSDNIKEHMLRNKYHFNINLYAHSFR